MVLTDSDCVPSTAMTEAAAGLLEDWEAGRARVRSGGEVSARDLVELHEAGLALMWATGTCTVEEAVDRARAMGS